MVTDSQTLRSEEFSDVGQMIERNAQVLVELWCRRAIEEQPHAKRCHHAVLRDGLLVLLKQLGAGLAQSDGEDACLHDQAGEHGEQRWEAGWSITEVVRDYQLLRLVIFEYLDKTLERPLTCREIMAIGLALDDAISASVTMYVNYRDEHALETERQRTDQERRQAAMLAQVSRNKDEFLAMLAHELRNPLAPILNALEILSLGDLDPALLANARQICERQVFLLVRLVDDLLDATRISQGKLELRKETVQLTSAVSTAVEVARPLIGGRHHTLDLALPDVPVELDVDPVRFAQMLTNLLNNAAKYTDPGGHIWLEAERDGDFLALRVRDDGIGIDADLLPHVFELFTQSDRAVGRGGLGIGLTLVRRLAELHGGSVSATSRGPGQGSEFTLRLPTRQPQADPKPTAADETRSNHPPVRMLLVDDNQDIATVLAVLLRRVGHEVRVAYDAASALSAVGEYRPKVILLDIGLPGMDGYELARELRKQPRLNDTCLVAITGYGQEEDVRRAEEAGFHFHLLKPIRLDAIENVLASCASLWNRKPS